MKRDDELINKLLVGLSSEDRHLEFKPSFIWDKKDDIYQKERIIKAVLAMINTPTGGNIILGIEETLKKIPKLVGANDEEFKSFQQIEIIKRDIQKFSSAPIGINFTWGEYEEDDKKFKLIAISVSEFEEVPTICRENGAWENKGKKLLYKGDIYSRLKKEVSSDRITETELKEIVKMSLNKEKGYILSFIPEICLRKESVKVEDKATPSVYEEQTKDLL